MATDPGTFSLAFDWIQNNDATSGNPLNLTSVATDYRASISTRIRVLNDLETSSAKTWALDSAGYVTGIGGSAFASSSVARV